MRKRLVERGSRPDEEEVHGGPGKEVRADDKVQ